jgi:hypothetical protein
MLFGSAAAMAGSVTYAIGAPINANSSTTTTTNTSNTAANQQRVQNIISKGNDEIARRLTTLNTLSAKVNAAQHLTATDKTTLSSEISSTITGLSSLKTTLDADTTATSAHTDAESIYTEYRVYAIVAPKVTLLKVADDQQVVQSKLSTLATKLQNRITAEQQAGKSVTTLQVRLSDMNTQLAAASKISSTIEASVVGLQPSDYNSNHQVLAGDNTQLKTARADNLAAFTDAKNIVSTLKSL